MSRFSVSRRIALKRMTQATLAGALGEVIRQNVPARGQTSGMAINVRLNEVIGTIKPTVYSQFAEHIGEVIYDGIWVGPESKIPNINGIRRSLVEHVRRIGRVVMRWPGGCFADKYHWR